MGVGVDVGLVLEELTSELDELLVETGALEDEEATETELELLLADEEPDEAVEG